MRKLFTLIAMALVAIGASAETKTYTWDKSLVTENSSADATLTVDDIDLIVTMNNNSTSDVIKPAVDFLHWNGASAATRRNAKFTAPYAGKVTVTYRSNNGSATDRIVAFGKSIVTGSDLNTLLSDANVYAAGLTEGYTNKTIEADVEAGDVYVYNASGGCSVVSIVYVAEIPDAPVSESVTLYSWESPKGTAIEEGGTIAYVNGDATNRVNYANYGYYTVCLNGKAANINDDAASANAGHMVLTLDQTLQEGDQITFTAYRNKNADGKKSSVYMLFQNGTVFKGVEGGMYWTNILSDDNNADYDNDGNTPNSYTWTVPAAEAGTNTISLTRSDGGTNLFITKIEITGVREVTKQNEITAYNEWFIQCATLLNQYPEFADRDLATEYKTAAANTLGAYKAGQFKGQENLVKDALGEAFLSLFKGTSMEALAKMYVSQAKEGNTATAISNVATSAPRAGKFIQNGRVVIVKDGKTYTTTGALLK